MSYGLEERFPEEIQAVGFEGILFCEKPSKIVRFITLPLENLEKNKALTMQIQSSCVTFLGNFTAKNKDL